MTLTEMIAQLRIELQDPASVSQVWSDADLTRAVQKSVSLMSRLLPNRAIIESTVIRGIKSETLTIASDKGTLAYKPVKPSSLTITGKIQDTDYRVNYLTGVVTEIGANLPDGNYTAKYDLDTQMLDISSFLPDYVKVERIEYPAGNIPPTVLTFDIFGDFAVIRGGNVALTENEHIRLIYFKKWVPPVTAASGDYPSHLDDAVIIGSAGQALIFKAEKYTQLAIISVAASKTTLDGIAFTDTETALAAAIARFQASVTEVAKMDTPLANAATALGKVNTELLTEGAGIVSAKHYLKTGDDFINASNVGARVGELFGVYAQAQIAIALEFEREATQDIAVAVGWEAKAARENIIGNSYINEAIQRLTIIARRLERASGYETNANQYLQTAGRYLASGQSKIQEMLIMLGLKIEFPMTKALSEQRD